MPIILATCEAEIRRIANQGQPGQKARPCLKNTQHTHTHTHTHKQRDWQMASMLEHLASKSKAQSSKTSPAKKKRRTQVLVNTLAVHNMFLFIGNLVLVCLIFNESIIVL
jgi:hypothetical protein